MNRFVIIEGKRQTLSSNFFVKLMSDKLIAAVQKKRVYDYYSHQSTSNIRTVPPAIHTSITLCDATDPSKKHAVYISEFINCGGMGCTYVGQYEGGQYAFKMFHVTHTAAPYVANLHKCLTRSNLLALETCFSTLSNRNDIIYTRQDGSLWYRMALCDNTSISHYDEIRKLTLLVRSMQTLEDPSFIIHGDMKMDNVMYQHNTKKMVICDWDDVSVLSYKHVDNTLHTSNTLEQWTCPQLAHPLYVCYRKHMCSLKGDTITVNDELLAHIRQQFLWYTNYFMNYVLAQLSPLVLLPVFDMLNLHVYFDKHLNTSNFVTELKKVDSFSTALSMIEAGHHTNNPVLVNEGYDLLTLVWPSPVHVVNNNQTVVGGRYNTTAMRMRFKGTL